MACVPYILFEDLHGRDDLKTFAHALIGRLAQRGNLGMVKVLRKFIDHGRLPEETVSAQTSVYSQARRSKAAKDSIGKA